MNLNAMAEEIHEISREKGFWPNTDGTGPERDPLAVIALMHSELSEALEAIRDNKWEQTQSWHSTPDTFGPAIQNEDGHMFWIGPEGERIPCTEEVMKYWKYVAKPEGVASELADTIIRILDACAAWGIDIDKAVALKVNYNRTRPVLHGRSR